MRELGIGTWLTRKQAKIVAGHLAEEFGENNVFWNGEACYLNSITQFSVNRGHSETELVFEANIANDQRRKEYGKY